MMQCLSAASILDKKAMVMDLKPAPNERVDPWCLRGSQMSDGIWHSTKVQQVLFHPSFISQFSNQTLADNQAPSPLPPANNQKPWQKQHRHPQSLRSTFTH